MWGIEVEGDGSELLRGFLFSNYLCLYISRRFKLYMWQVGHHLLLPGLVEGF